MACEGRKQEEKKFGTRQKGKIRRKVSEIRAMIRFDHRQSWPPLSHCVSFEGTEGEQPSSAVPHFPSREYGGNDNNISERRLDDEEDVRNR